MAEGALTWTRYARGFQWLHSTKLAPWQVKAIRGLRRRLRARPRDEFWILSSGTQAVDEVKAIALKHEAVLASAEAVNRHLSASAADRWMVALPLFHVGGLGILARAHLSGSALIFHPHWNARSFVNELRTKTCTLTSLVPTQVHDLVVSGLEAPACLRAVVVGGGALDPELYARGRRLGWPLLPSYGLTECASQVATASLATLTGADFPALSILPHVEVDLRGSRVWLRSPACAHLVARGKESGAFSLEDPLRRGWLATEDLAERDGDGLRPLGRGDEVVKVLGELVPVAALEQRAQSFFHGRGLRGDMTVLAVAGGREGHRFWLVTDTHDSLLQWEAALAEWNASQPGPSRMKYICWVQKIPRGDLGKVKKGELRANLSL